MNKRTRELLFVAFLALLTLLAGIAISGCTDTGWQKIVAYGEAHSIQCFSGGVEIYKGKSTGKVQSPPNSDGYQFKSQETGLLTEVSGECIIVTLSQ
jgi:hypothetical protein